MRLPILTWLCGALLPAQAPPQGHWSSNPTTGGPPPTADHAAVYDMARERMIWFGGHDAGFNTQAATWEFDGVTWTSTAPAASPTARTGHAMAYDAARGRTVLFGGVANLLAAAPFSDTWEHDGTTWAHRAVSPTPSARINHAMAFDMIRGRTVLHGGRGSQSAVLSDTWEWDGTAWTAAAGPGPSPRFHHSMCFDLNRSCCVLFGGFDGVTNVGETWEWDGAAWQQRLPATSPSPRSGHAMAYDVLRAVNVLHGGSVNGAETWEWDGAAWSQHGSTNRPKVHHTLVYDSRLQRATLAGGMIAVVPKTILAETEHYGHPIPGSWVALGQSCPGSAATPFLFAPTSVSSGPATGQSAVVQVTPTWFHAFFVFGWSDTVDGGTPLPYPLHSYGMPGCALQVSRDAITSAFPVNGVASVAIPVANDPFLVGVQFFVQGFSLDLAANAGGFTTTNRLLATVGRP